MDPSITWSCEQCSTINRSSTTKCSFCGILKHCEPSKKSSSTCGGKKHRSRSGAVVAQHISSHAGLISDSMTQDNKQAEQSIKWTCVFCSYKNWPNATKCVMCNKRKNSTGLCRSAEDIIGAVGGASNIELSSNEEQCKWKCLKCTYENWPRSSKCTLCHTVKPSSPPLMPLISSVASEEGSSVDVAELQAKVQLLSTSDKVKQIRNKMSETDWLFLNACVGVVNNEFSAVQPYILATTGYILYILIIYMYVYMHIYILQMYICVHVW